MVYQIPSSAVKLAQVFRLVEGVKESLDIEGYSVSQTTLDDVRISVFLYFSSFQIYFVGIYSLCQSTV